MACQICGRMMCDHTPMERGQSLDEMISDYNTDCKSLKKKSKKKVVPKKKNPKKKKRSKLVTCYKCNGTGMLTFGSLVGILPCDRCGGKGKF